MSDFLSLVIVALHVGLSVMFMASLCVDYSSAPGDFTDSIALRMCILGSMSW